MQAITEGQSQQLGEDGQPIENLEETETLGAPVEIPKPPKFDPNAMEDMAPAERLRYNQAQARAEKEARDKMIEDMIAAERERDPDALDEDIISKVNL